MTLMDQRVRVESHGDVATAVMAVHALCTKIGMNRGAGSALATAVSELGSNIVKYASGGRITLRSVRRGRLSGVEVIVEDRGPGIADIERAMTDHVSTGGTLGLGLPGTRRLVDEFEIDSKPSVGTRIRIVKWG